MKVAYLTANAPHSPHRGDTLIAYNQVKGLARRAEVHLLSFVESDEEDRLLREALGPYCASIQTVRDPKWRRYPRLLRTLWNRLPLQVNLYSAASMRSRLLHLLDETPIDVVHAQTMRMAHVCRGHNVPCVVDFIDALSLNMQRRAEKEHRPWLKPLLRMEQRLAQRYEKMLLRSFQGFSVVSEQDRKWLGDERTVVMPCGTAITPAVLQAYRYIPRQQRMIFHGNMYYFPNVEGVLAIARDIWPELHRRFPDAAFYVAGHRPAPEISRLHGQDNIVVTGSVDDMVAELCAAQIGIYWLNSGTGLQNKILEALACGLPVVASPLAIQGIPGLTDDHLVIADTPEAFISAVDDLMNDPERRETLAAAGQAFITQHYSWKSNIDRLLNLWRSATGAD